MQAISKINLDGFGISLNLSNNNGCIIKFPSHI